MSDIEISSARTIARPFTPHDAAEVLSCISGEITRFMAWEPPASMADFAEVWRDWLPAIEERSDLHLVARDKSEGHCLGIVGLHALKSGTPELGIWLRYDAHGMGLGRELIGAAIAWASKNVRIEYFEYPVAEENIACRQIAEAYGGQIMERRINPKYRSVVYHIPSV
ncbi:GNAT family N-acetyltransferase [Rhizobium mongolense]|uniref:GNAT family N-acetyltransferase n=1 Tax=Rhizobium mongolense TaxID=57676 RepID=UPI000B82B7FD|nr:GNAT family N-acetyltransferase [Rhizobium mongolense]